MFTGIIEGRGIVCGIHEEADAIRLVVAPPEHLTGRGDALGDSIAINGCCLTIVETAGGRWTFQAGAETLSKTNLGDLQPGDMVNLERAMPADGRFGGHIVQG
ncbi:MAG: riboflavin synthase, partial [Planctomycetaceae bacterium]